MANSNVRKYSAPDPKKASSKMVSHKVGSNKPSSAVSSGKNPNSQSGVSLGTTVHKAGEGASVNHPL